MEESSCSIRKFFKNNLFSAMMAIALSFFVIASPITVATDKTAKKHTAAVEQVAKLININHASIQDLTNLKGVGEKKAIAIVKYRNDNGKFKSIEQLAEVKGIGMSIVEKNRKMIKL